jgi:arsenite methyltransferase
MRIHFLLLVLSAALSAQTIPNPSRGGEYQFPPDARRDPWQKPDDVIKALNFSSSETVAVIEEGYPYFAPRIAPFVKKVYAVNTDLRAFQGRGALPSSISTIVSTSASPALSRLNIDTVIMVDLLRRIPQRMPYYQALTAGLNPGARVVVIDRKLPAAFPAATAVTDLVVKAELRLAGFRLVQSFTFLPYQYFLVFEL